MFQTVRSGGRSEVLVMGRMQTCGVQRGPCVVSRGARAEGVLKRVIQDGGAHAKEGLNRRSVPAHCYFLFTRLATISLTALSTNAVEIASPLRRRAA
jgi:hypothetical protein